MAGGGVCWDDAAKSLAAFAERAGVPAFMNGAGRGALTSDHPNAVFQTRGRALGHADVVLVLGTPLDFRPGYGCVNVALAPEAYRKSGQVSTAI